ncbi:hypothetical protein J2X76_003649 [Neorhizobium sp. 2083]|nr:hypothetical protein [Neorhizobium sp. 2083]MDR6818472.1 hypothetical protein [Neorhizobium sp. 2083]
MIAAFVTLFVIFCLLCIFTAVVFIIAGAHVEDAAEHFDFNFSEWGNPFL